MVDSELLIKALNSAIPIVQQGGLSGAMYRAEEGDEPDGYALDYRDWEVIKSAIRWILEPTYLVQVVHYVNNNPSRAQQALQAEQAGQNRITLIRALRQILD